MRRWVKVSVVALLGAGVCLAPDAPAGEMTCREILDKSVDKNSLGFENAEAIMTLEIYGRSGAQRVRKVRIQSQEEDGLNRSLVRFLEPADVAGTGFLVIEQKGEDDLQRLYMPALKKSKRIKTDQKGKSFMGTDFTYGDLESRDLENQDCTRQPDETLSDQSVYVVVSVPRNDEQYSKTIAWIDKKTLVALKVEMYDKSGKLLKVMKAKKVEKIGDRFVTTLSEMTNVQKGTHTVIKIHQIDFDKTFPAETFTERNLERG